MQSVAVVFTESIARTIITVAEMFMGASRKTFADASIQSVASAVPRNPPRD